LERQQPLTSGELARPSPEISTKNGKFILLAERVSIMGRPLLREAQIEAGVANIVL